MLDTTRLFFYSLCFFYPWCFVHCRVLFTRLMLAFLIIQSKSSAVNTKQSNAFIHSLTHFLAVTRSVWTHFTRPNTDRLFVSWLTWFWYIIIIFTKPIKREIKAKLQYPRLPLVGQMGCPVHNHDQRWMLKASPAGLRPVLVIYEAHKAYCVLLCGGFECWPTEHFPWSAQAKRSLLEKHTGV